MNKRRTVRVACYNKRYIATAIKAVIKNISLFLEMFGREPLNKLPNRKGSNFAARSKLLGLAVLPELPVRAKYLMTKSMGFADECKPSFACSVSSKAEATEHTRSFGYPAKLMANEAEVQESKLVHQFIFGQTKRIPSLRITGILTVFHDGK
jgi:hypothetical protein